MEGEIWVDEFMRDASRTQHWRETMTIRNEYMVLKYWWRAQRAYTKAQRAYKWAETDEARQKAIEARKAAVEDQKTVKRLYGQELRRVLYKWKLAMEERKELAKLIPP